MLKIINITQDEVPADIFGGKAAGLALLCDKGYKIPRTVVIESTRFQSDFDSQDFQNTLKNILAPLMKAGAYDVAVRSSCTIEDGFNDSMAGYFQSFLGAMSFDDIIESMKSIVSGLDKLPNNYEKMGIIIQQKISADYAGVVYTSNPNTYSKVEMIISYTDGLADKLVSGEVTGAEVWVSVKGDFYKLHSDINNAPDVILGDLARKTKELEKSLNYPLDIEWVAIENKLYFLQCRPLASITMIKSASFYVSKDVLRLVPAPITLHDKIKIRLGAQNADILVSDAYVYVHNSSRNDAPEINIMKSPLCVSQSAVIIYPRRISDSVVRSFIGDRRKVKVKSCCRYAARTHPKHDDLYSCLLSFSEMATNEFWISAVIVQEIFDSLYTGAIKQTQDGFIIEIIRGHFFSKGIYPPSQYYLNCDGEILHKNEIKQCTWFEIIEGCEVYCVCNEDVDTLVTLSRTNLKNILNCFMTLFNNGESLKQAVVEFGVLKREEGDLQPYLIDFFDDDSTENITVEGVSTGIISSGRVTGRTVRITENYIEASLDAHFHSDSTSKINADEKVIFFCENAAIALRDSVVEQYAPENIGFVFENSGLTSHLPAILREKRIPAIVTGNKHYNVKDGDICTIDAETPARTKMERLIFDNFK